MNDSALVAIITAPQPEPLDNPPVIVRQLDIDYFLSLGQQAFDTIRGIYQSFDITFGNHTYNGFVMLLACLIMFYLLFWIWGDDGDDD